MTDERYLKMALGLEVWKCLAFDLTDVPMLEKAIAAALQKAAEDEREACGAAVERAYLACTYPGVFNRHVWADIVKQAKAEIRSRGEVKA